MRPGRSRTFKPKPRRVTFGAVGCEPISYIGELPVEHRGIITARLYVWNDRRARRVDRRDLPTLIKTAGLDNLGGTAIDRLKERQAEQKRAKLEKAQAKSKNQLAQQEQQQEQQEVEQ